MKIGILNACSPQDEADFDTYEFESFVRLFSQSDQPFEFREYRITEGEFPNSAECDAYLITGSPKGIYDSDAWIGRLGQFIRETYAAKRKLVGICFGHQMLAHHLGGEAKKSDKGWGIGLHPLPILKDYPWMDPPLQNGAFYYCHQDQVTLLPDGAELLAGSQFCPNGMFLLDNQVLGLQAHPEFTEPVMQRAITWVEESEPMAKTNLDSSCSASDSADGAVMAKWIGNFLMQTD